MTAQETYEELQTTYYAIQDFLDSYQFGPEQDSLIAKQEQLGEKIYLYNKAIIEKNSQVLNASIDALQDMVVSAKEAREPLDNVSDYIATANKIAGAMDKVLTQISKFV